VKSGIQPYSAVPALSTLFKYFMAEAKEDPDVGQYMADLAQQAAALAEKLTLLSGGGRDEL
jgi:hypothetical protein